MSIKKIYLKDSSFESPNSPKVFLEKMNPKIKIDAQVSYNKLSEVDFEVVLSLTVTASPAEDEGSILFICEVEQGGLFGINGFEGEELEKVLKIFCPNQVFPYARQQIDNLVLAGGFPALMLAPINFEGLKPGNNA